MSSSPLRVVRGPRRWTCRPSRLIQLPKRWTSFVTQLRKRPMPNQLRLRRRRLHPRRIPQHAPPSDPAATAAKPAGTAAPKAPVPQKQPPAKPPGPPAQLRPGPPKSQPKEKAPPPPLNFDDTTTGPASQPPTQGAPNEPERAPTLAADAPASRVGSVINDGSGNPSLCLVQLWACRKKCGSCENAFCQATFPDRSNSFHTLHRCRDCKRAEGRNRAAQPAPASTEDSWQHSNWEWNSEWNSNVWTPAWGSQDGWQEGWRHGWHQ